MKRICLTQEELIKIKKELDERKNKKRKEIAARLNAAKELGDLSENTEYITAKEDQAFNEARVKDLDNLIRGAEIVEKSQSGKVCIGNEIKLKSEVGVHQFLIVGPEGIDLSSGRISYESPLGKALIGKKVGQMVEVVAPKGKIKYKIVAIN